MNSKQKRVLKVKVPECGDGAWVLFSASKRDPKETFGEFRVKTNFSFLWDAGEYAAEWEPEYGPIQIWHKCNANDIDAREHYFYEYQNNIGAWSQLAVSNLELPQAANAGDWQYIFNVLKDWAENK